MEVEIDEAECVEISLVFRFVCGSQFTDDMYLMGLKIFFI